MMFKDFIDNDEILTFTQIHIIQSVYEQLPLYKIIEILTLTNKYSENELLTMDIREINDVLINNPESIRFIGNEILQYFENDMLIEFILLFDDYLYTDIFENNDYLIEKIHNFTPNIYQLVENWFYNEEIIFAKSKYCFEMLSYMSSYTELINVYEKYLYKIMNNSTCSNETDIMKSNTIFTNVYKFREIINNFQLPSNYYILIYNYLKIKEIQEYIESIQL